VKFEIVSQRYWQRKNNGENISYSTKVFCSGKCKQKAYRIRRALERNIIE